jgi:hypothetical protein
MLNQKKTLSDTELLRQHDGNPINNNNNNKQQQQEEEEEQQQQQQKDCFCTNSNSQFWYITQQSICTKYGVKMT